MVGHRRFEGLSWTMASEGIGPPQLESMEGWLLFLAEVCVEAARGIMDLEEGRGGRESTPYPQPSQCCDSLIQFPMSW